MVTTRAKFYCTSETRSAHGADGARTYRFQAAYDLDLPEDQRYSKYTPSGSLDITVDNPNVAFELGRHYYLDFTPVPDATTENR